MQSRPIIVSPRAEMRFPFTSRYGQPIVVKGPISVPMPTLTRPSVRYRSLAGALDEVIGDKIHNLPDEFLLVLL